MGSKKHTRRGFITHPNYFFRHQDPEIGRLMSVLDKKKIRPAQVKGESNVSPSTLRSMRIRKTRNAFFSTLERIARVAGETYVRQSWDGDTGHPKRKR